MTAQTRVDVNDTAAMLASGSRAKFVSDALSVLEIKLLFLVHGWYWYLVRPLVIPLGLYFWLRVLVPDDPELVKRVMVGSIVFGVSISTANMLGQQIIMDRFMGRLKLIITMPVSKGAYVTGLLAFAAIQTIPVIFLILGFAWASGVDIHLTWAFFPFIVPILISMAGITLIIASYAPSQEVGSIAANLTSIGIVVVSPVFFTMDQAPLVLRWIGWVSPMRYAADGIMKSLSGETGVLVEFVVLAGFGLAAMAIGVWALRWRER